MDSLKLIAFDGEDLAVISANLQDAVLNVGDIAYLPQENRLVALANRFDWMSAEQQKDGTKSTAPSTAQSATSSSLQRRRCAIRFERVLSAQVAGISLNAKREVLSLLAIEFKQTEAPAGLITLYFSGGGAIRLAVECVEVELRDLGAAWSVKSIPSHPES